MTWLDGPLTIFCGSGNKLGFNEFGVSQELQMQPDHTIVQGAFDPTLGVMEWFFLTPESLRGGQSDKIGAVVYF